MENFDEEFKSLRRFYVTFRFEILILVGVLASLILVWFVVWGIRSIIDHQKETDVSQKVTDIEMVMTQARTRVDTAIQSVELRKGDFLKKYSEGFDDQLGKARQSIHQFFEPSVGLLAQLHNAQAKRDWKVAYDLLGQAESLKNQDIAVVDRILGPPGTKVPGYYEELDQKVYEVDAGLVVTAQRHIDDVESYISMLSVKSLCGSTNTLSYESVLPTISEAQQELDKAKLTALVITEGMVDKPLVYEQASAAKAIADNVKLSVDRLSAQADQAQREIQSCESKITDASTYLWFHSYRSTEANGQLLFAQDERDAAYNACYTQDFSSVTNHTNTCVDYANMAVWFATEPTETPEPPPTAIPIVIDDDDDEEESSPVFDDGDSGSDYFDDGDSGSDYFDDGDSGSDYFDDGDSGSDYFDDGDSGSDYFDDGDS